MSQHIPVQHYQHWRLEADTNGILWLYFDKKNAQINTINREVMEEFSAITQALAKETRYQAVILASAKTKGFIAGADISQFIAFKDIEEARMVLQLGQSCLDQWEALPIPTVAMIDGFCLGGGLEMALACRYRVVEESVKTRIGLPEVKLGIHPGWGGTVRLPRLIGAREALNFILSGYTVSGRQAAKLGVADVAVPKRQLVHAATYYALHQPPIHRLSLLQQWIQQTTITRQLLGYFIRRKLGKKINPLHYPAPYHALDNWEWVGVATQQAFEREAKSCATLFFSETCHNLVRVFFLQEKLKNLESDLSYHPKHIHVVGAGTMGGDIAAWCALQGLTVTLQDVAPQVIAAAIKRAFILFKEKLKESYRIQQAMDRLIPDMAGDGIAKAALIIEAVVEDLAVKQSIFKMLEEKANPDAIFATNTSSIPLDKIAALLSQPARLIGLHFFNPVAKMQLVEVVKGEHTNADILAKATRFVRLLDHLPLIVKSSPGFLINRILMPYLLESMKLLEEGIPKQVIDQAMVEFGMPMGPITLADAVGLDVCLSVANYLSSYFHQPIPVRLSELVSQHHLGLKTQSGFYQYDQHGHKIKLTETPYTDSLTTISDRLVSTMVTEAFACLNEGVVANADLLDAGMIFGTGFAPFRGGPMQYAKSQGKRDE